MVLAVASETIELGESLQAFLAATWGVYARNAVTVDSFDIQQKKYSVAVHGCLIVLKTNPSALELPLAERR